MSADESRRRIGHDIVVVTDEPELPIIKDLLVDGRRLWVHSGHGMRIELGESDAVTVVVPLLARTVRFMTGVEVERLDASGAPASESAS